MKLCNCTNKIDIYKKMYKDGNPLCLRCEHCGGGWYCRSCVKMYDIENKRD